MKRILGWLVNFYPHHVFYSDAFMPELVFRAGESDDPHETGGNTAALGVAVAASRALKKNGKFTAEYTAVTNRGEDIGDYRLTVERLR